MKNSFICILCFCAGLLSTAVRAVAVEIPLGTGGSVIYSSGTAPSLQGAIGYVDIDRVFSEHPMTRRAREDFKQEVEKRRKEINRMQQAVAEAEKAAAVSSTSANQERAQTAPPSEKQPATAAPVPLSSTATDITPVFPETAVSTAAAPSPAAGSINASTETAKGNGPEPENAQKKLDAMKADLANRIQNDKEDLTQLEEKQTADVMADIYFLLEKIAKEEHITVVFDKNNILYGQSVRDITGKVLERLKGR